MANLFDTFKRLSVGLAGSDEVKGQEVPVLYGLGFSDPVMGSKINQFIFVLHQDILDKLLVVAFQGRKVPRWIKKPKEVKDEITDYCKEHGLHRTPVLEKLIKDNYEDFLRETRADDKAFKKAGIELQRPETNAWF